MGGLIVLRGFALSALLLCPASLRADEGMWPFGQLPLEQMQARYGFAPDQAWLKHLRLATVIFGNEGTGAFVGREGLVLTNQHVAHASLQQVSSPQRDLVQLGFVARNRSQELRIPGLELRVLASMRNITREVARAVQPGASARNAVREDILRRETVESGLDCRLVDFQPGGETWLYRYRKFSDVRLVMAPEYDIAAFGKEWDNFAYPRHNLDFSLFRVYEQGRPFHSDHALTWTRKGIASGDMTFVAGHPGRTNRQETWLQMDFRRRVVNPLVVRTLERHLHTLSAYAARDAEHARQVSTEILAAANFLKVYREEIRGLEDPLIAAPIQASERRLRAWIEGEPSWKVEVAGSWPALEGIFLQQEALAREYQLTQRLYRSLERGPLAQAVDLVRRIGQSDGRGTPAEFAPSLNRELETLLLSDGLEEARAWLGASHPLVQALLSGSSPRAVAALAIQTTRIDEPGFVRALVAGGPKALARSADPLIHLAVRLDPYSRAVQRRYEALEDELREHSSRIAKARTALQDQVAYPEADFTLRLSYGAVRPYPAEGTLQQPFTTFGGLFDRADAWGPAAEAGSWALPPRWRQRRQAIEPSIPLNFITTNDIIGGNSGSPVVDRNGELVGLVFDGNLQSIVGRFHYDERQNRCIAVDARAILEALAKVYDAEHLVKELTEK